MEHAKFTIQIRQEALSTGEDVYVALCLELDVASQGTTIKQAKANVMDAIESFFEIASAAEIEPRLSSGCQSVFLRQPFRCLAVPA